MAKLIQLSNTSWKHPFTDRKKEMHLWVTNTEVAKYCGLKNSTKRLLNIKFEKKFNINETRYFQITSGREIYFPRDFQEKTREIIFNNPKSFFVVTVLDTPETLYTPADIIWFKNVTNESLGRAYLDLDSNAFTLSFPNRHKQNALSPQINELILLYQKVDGIPSFTHLVTPIDNKLVNDKSRKDFRFGRRVKVIAKTDINNIVPVSSTMWKKVKLSGITQGNVCKISNIKGSINYEELQLNIWEWLKESFRPGEKQSEEITSSIIQELEISHPDLTVIEGELRLVKHLVKERNRKIVMEKKRQAIKKNSLRCEVCSFSFPEKFHSEFIECHHISPISQTQGKRETKLEDLALVCSNCHRMLHTKFDGLYLSISQLQKRIDDIKSQLI